jgi:hypothetical protein
VPAGKCLIVESASVLTKLPSGQRAYVQFYGNYKRVGNLYFSLKHQGTFDGREVWTVAEPARIYGSGSAQYSSISLPYRAQPRHGQSLVRGLARGLSDQRFLIL